jgi:hypothetical protein
VVHQEEVVHQVEVVRPVEVVLLGEGVVLQLYLLEEEGEVEAVDHLV